MKMSKRVPDHPLDPALPQILISIRLAPLHSHVIVQRGVVLFM